jgi:hypothetical protein
MHIPHRKPHPGAGRQLMARFCAASQQKLSPPEAVNQEEIPEENRQFHLPASARHEPAGKCTCQLTRPDRPGEVIGAASKRELSA